MTKNKTVVYSGMKISLEAPTMDKGWSFQILADSTNGMPEIRDSILRMLRTPIVKRANPFLQGDCPEWLMIEFWTNDENAIIEASIILQETVLFAKRG